MDTGKENEQKFRCPVCGGLRESASSDCKSCGWKRRRTVDEQSGLQDNTNTTNSKDWGTKARRWIRFVAVGILLPSMAVLVIFWIVQPAKIKCAWRTAAVMGLGGSSGNQARSDYQKIIDRWVESVDEVINELQSTPAGRGAIERIGGKDAVLSLYQRQHPISDRDIEAAIKEWVMTNDGNLDWNVEDVIWSAVRNQGNGIPSRYLPESEK